MKVKELLDGPDKWMQGRSARLANGSWCEASQDGAVCWCLLGAVYRCYQAEGIGRILDIRARIHERVGMNPAHWNDSHDRTFAEVRQLVEELDI